MDQRRRPRRHSLDASRWLLDTPGQSFRTMYHRQRPSASRLSSRTLHRSVRTVKAKENTVLNRYVRDEAEDSGCKWRKSSRSYGSGECIEVAAPSSKGIAVRDSKNVQSAVLSFSSA
ncbi:MAG: DUF397 domain-containing protein, partial [Trebonia sp.]